MGKYEPISTFCSQKLNSLEVLRVRCCSSSSENSKGCRPLKPACYRDGGYEFRGYLLPLSWTRGSILGSRGYGRRGPRVAVRPATGHRNHHPMKGNYRTMLCAEKTRKMRFQLLGNEITGVWLKCQCQGGMAWLGLAEGSQTPRGWRKYGPRHTRACGRCNHPRCWR